MLAEHGDVEVAGEARNADEAEDLLERFEPELLFLDIQMPGRSGLEMLEQFANPPQTILTTAFDRYAVRGFELNAVDYLLKPIAPERLAEALRRVRERIEGARGRAGKSAERGAAGAGVCARRRAVLAGADGRDCAACGRRGITRGWCLQETSR